MSTTIIAALLAAAGGFHLAALPSHLHESAAAGAFFAAVALGQLAGAVLVATRPSSRTTVAVILGNVVVLAIWAVSRTTGLPVGGELGVREPLAALDGLAAVAEILVVAGALTVLRRAGMIRLRSARWQPVVAMGVVWLAAGGVATGLVDPAHEHGAHPTPVSVQVPAAATDVAPNTGQPVAPAPLPLADGAMQGGHSHSGEDQHSH
jgi:hypothetical protein